MQRQHFGLLLLLGLTACEGVFIYPHGSGNHDARPVAGQRVFTTSTKYRGGLIGGVEGADEICADHALEAGLPGVFKAWLSQVDNSAADRLTHATKPYVLVNGTIVADSWDDLLRYDLQHAIDLDEHGRALVADVTFGTAVWSNTRIDGRASPWMPGGTPTSNPRRDCTLWSSIDGGVGMLGDWNATDNGWTMTSGGILCNETARLYCFQQ